MQLLILNGFLNVIDASCLCSQLGNDSDMGQPWNRRATTILVELTVPSIMWIVQIGLLFLTTSVSGSYNLNISHDMNVIVLTVACIQGRDMIFAAG